MTKKGFSLLELLVAIGILSVGILVILQAVGFCSRIVSITSDTINALILAEDKLDELQYKEKTKALTQMNSSEKSGKYLWEYALALDPDLNLYKCELNVSWNRLERNEKLVINTYLRNEK